MARTAPPYARGTTVRRGFWRQEAWTHRVRTREYSLKHVLILSLTLSCLFPLLLIGSISYVSLQRLQGNAVVSSLSAAARQNSSQIDAMVSVLDNVTQLAVMEFITAGSVERYVAARGYFDVFRASRDIKTGFNLLSFANPDIGLIVLYDAGAHSIIAQSNPTRDDVDLEHLPRLLHRNAFTAFAPAPSLQKAGTALVLAAARLVPNRVGRQVYLYFEIGGKSLQKILGREQYGITATHFIVNTDGLISYSDDPAIFPPGSRYGPSDGGGSWFLDRGYVVFPQHGEAGWTMMVSFPRRQFDAERMKWLAGLLIGSLLSFSASLLIAFFIWRILYVPLGLLRAEMDTVGAAVQRHAPASLVVREYNYLQDKVEEMRDRISSLIEELKAKELSKRKLEVEKLLFQINPHFLYNTLNNVHWLARINGQEEISGLVADLTKILHYNLRRTGEMASAREESDMLRRYVALQQRRLDLRIGLAMEVDPAAAEVEVPRFILQPLVENAIQHCHRETVAITVTIRRAPGDRVVLEVRDDGAGMSAEAIGSILSRDWEERMDHASGLGIRYVRSLIDMVYGGKGVILIASEPGAGTTVSIDIPVETPR